MKNQIYILLILFIFINRTATAQKNKFHVWVNHSNDLTEFGNIVETKDSSIIFNQVLGHSSELIISKEIKIQNLNIVSFRKKSSVPKNFILGILVGFGTGYLIGYSKDNSISTTGGYSIKKRNKEAGIKGGKIGFFTGAILGLIKGSIKMKIPINKSHKQYQLKKYKIIKLKI